MEELLSCLRAAAEPTRLRLLALCAQGDMTVSDLTHILGQSQPRVSRHLKLLCEAGLLDRFREGSWVIYRFADALKQESNSSIVANSSYSQPPVFYNPVVGNKRNLRRWRNCSPV